MEKLNQREIEKIKHLFDNALEMILIFNEEGKIRKANKAAREYLEYKEGFETVLITDIFRQVMSLDHGRVQLVNIEQGKITETFAYRKNQTCFAIDLKVIIEKTESGFMGICNAINASVRADAIKDMVKAQEKVGDATKVRNEFVSNVTHELRTPVNGIMGIAKNLMDTPLNAEQMESINIIQLCCTNMSAIINNLLDFSKLEAGKFTIEEREFSFREMLDKVMAMNMSQVNDKGLKLVLNVSNEIPERLIGDELRISQILTNLISNAVKFTSVGQIVVDVVRTMERENIIELFFMVIDTGIGIAESDMNKLFKSFSQVDASITRRFGGTGLGLTIVKQLVQLMDGEVHVESEKGKGSTFSFSIRVKKSAEDSSNMTMSGGKYVYEGNQRKVVEEFEDEDLYDVNQLYQFGTEENVREIKATMEKLIICIEMENWDKAENFAGIVKKLVENQKELKRKAFRMEMTIRKEDHDNAIVLYNEFSKMFQDALENRGE